MVSDSFGKITSMALDPIEKKPLARFMPGSKILSVGSFGCNLHCPFCQNASISQVGASQVPWRQISPNELVHLALSLCNKGNVGIAYTYNEPLVNFEFVHECAKRAHKAGLVNVLVSNGVANAPVIEQLAPYLDAVNIDLKAFEERFYDFVKGDLSACKRTIELLVSKPTCHVEVTTLIIPGKNDSDEEIAAIAGWLASLDPEIPYHVSRFFPCYRMKRGKPTPVARVHELADVARRYLKHVYTGNC